MTKRQIVRLHNQLVDQLSDTKKLIHRMLKEELNLKVTQKSRDRGETYHTVQLTLTGEPIGSPVCIVLSESVDHDDLVYDLEIK
jgi:hypothetical protein